MAKKYVLLDRDGTIIYDKHYLSEIEDVELLPNAAKGLRKIQQMGYGLIVITNQSGVAKGYFSQEQVEKVNKHLQEMLKDEGVFIEGFFYCPHDEKDNCECRKPKTKLANEAAKIFNFNPKDCFMIGDKKSDIDMGKNIKAKTILVRTGKGQVSEFEAKFDYVADNLDECAKIIKLLNFNKELDAFEKNNITAITRRSKLKLVKNTNNNLGYL
jgi:D-glycero-D-manno-heptose 1,7-bisphosphate phosphatase